MYGPLQTILALLVVGGAAAWLAWQAWLKLAGKKGCACSGCGRGEAFGAGKAGREALVQLDTGKRQQNKQTTVGR